MGLIIGEWRRRKHEQRVLYLCPTNQLVHQVAREATQKYGLHVNTFTGRKSSYNEIAKREYQNAEAIAVTSYSSLFNTAPYFTNPQLIILDDAHAAENSIASFWSVRIERTNPTHKALHAVISSILKPLVPSHDYAKVIGDWESAWDKSWVDKIPTPLFYSIIPEFIAAFDSHMSEHERENEGKKHDLSFQWSVVRDHLYACHLYVGAQEILLRPLIPPTETHAPFANATQRLYMSATLGEGGDLERLTGRKTIKRLEIPVGWDTQGIGRRFFFFPALEDEDLKNFTLSIIEKAGRSLVLVPDDLKAKEFRSSVKDDLAYDTFDAQQIESSKDPFIESEKAVAVIANRYDGIDFPGDECRLLIAQGLPRATNLQERFLMSRMSASALLSDRILTRIIQAVGRCTRSHNDYSAIIILGEELCNYLMNRDIRRFLHPELQAELEYGIEQSKASSQEMLENFDLFIDHDEEWNQAEEDIIALRDSTTQTKLPGTVELRNAVASEITYQYLLWNADFPGALEQCRSVLGQFTAPELRGYRALWHYLAGSAAYLGGQNDQSSLLPLSRQHFSESARAASGIPWLNKLSQYQESGEATSVSNNQTLLIVERMELMLDKLGIVHDRNFASRERSILTGLSSTNTREFEAAHTLLGELLGYEADNRESRGAPDPWWLVDENFCFIFEDHSGANPESTLNIEKARQAGSHPNWVRENLQIKPGAEILSVLITPVKKADPEALPHLREVYYWNLDDFRTWSQNALSVIRDLRRTFTEPGNLDWRNQAVEAYTLHKLCPVTLAGLLRQSCAADVLQSS